MIKYLQSDVKIYGWYQHIFNFFKPHTLRKICSETSVNVIIKLGFREDQLESEWDLQFGFHENLP